MVRQRRNCFQKFGGFNQPTDFGQHNLVPSLQAGNEATQEFGFILVLFG
ncbi:hypothetical protein [Nostoc sp. ChiSLP03a]|nr:hypothetical protein [Nostoc sp. ChiSLP03a]MDZ8216104.1 hypothetical protein [Nostoc sp. ChiSLP03a]